MNNKSFFIHSRLIPPFPNFIFETKFFSGVSLHIFGKGYYLVSITSGRQTSFFIFESSVPEELICSPKVVFRCIRGRNGYTGNRVLKRGKKLRYTIAWQKFLFHSQKASQKFVSTSEFLTIIENEKKKKLEFSINMEKQNREF